MSWSPAKTNNGPLGWGGAISARPYTVYGDGPRVVVLDLGLDPSLVSWLAVRNCRLTVVGCPTSCRRVLDLGPELVVIGGQPEGPDRDQLIQTVAQLRADVPLFGIGMGFELLVLACGGTLSDRPGVHQGDVRVVDLETGRRFTTAQDHRLHATRQTLARTPLTALQLSVDDLTVEAVGCQDSPAVAVNYQPARGESQSGFLLERMLGHVFGHDRLSAALAAPGPI